MAGQNANEVRVAAGGGLYVAPKGTPGPTTLDDLAAPFVNLGFASEDGATISRSQESDTIRAWQTTAPIRYVITGAEARVGINLMQFNPDTIALYFGGGSVSKVSEKLYRYDIPPGDTLDERSFVLAAIDGDSKTFFCFPRGIVVETDDLTVNRASAEGLPVTIATMATTGSLGYILTNDPAFEPPTPVPPPAKPTVTKPTNNATDVDGAVAMEGTGVDGATVTLYVAATVGGAGTASGTQTLSGSTAWSIVANPKPDTGDHWIYATQTKDGQTSDPSDRNKATFV